MGMDILEQRFSQWKIEKADESTQKLARFMFFAGAHAVLESVAEGMKENDGGIKFSSDFSTMCSETMQELQSHGIESEVVQ